MSNDVTTPEDTELAAAASELKALEDARARRAAAAAHTDDLATVKRAIERERTIAALEEKHGVGCVGTKVAVIDTRLGCVAVKRPTGPAYKAFQEAVARDGYMDKHVQTLVRPCVAHPDLEAFDRITSELPGVPGILAGLIVDLAKGHAREVSGK